MAQEYNAILPGGSTNILQDNIDSRKNDETLRSGFSGSAFPTSPVPVAGQRCYREDLKKEYIFNGEGWVEVASSGAIAQEVTLARGTHAELQDRLSVSMNPDGTLKTPATANVDEFKVSGLEPTYVSTNSFSVPGDVRAIFTENRRLKITQGAETVYPAVVSASYDDIADKTTIVIDNITITNEIAAIDFSMVQMGLPANLDAGTLNGKSDTAFQDVSEKDQPGGYAGLDVNGALTSKIRSTYISDFNTATIGGLYYAGTGTLNGPPDYALTALVIDRLRNANLTQMAFSATTKSVYIRCSRDTSNTEWTDWRKINEATWGSISGTLADQTDLQTALDGKANTSHSHSYAPIPSSSSLPVGTWCLCYNNATSDIANGGTIAGANLKIFRLSLETASGNTSIKVDSFTAGSLPGTWKNITGTKIGKYSESTSGGVTTTTRHSGLFVRIA